MAFFTSKTNIFKYTTASVKKQKSTWNYWCENRENIGKLRLVNNLLMKLACGTKKKKMSDIAEI